MGGSTILLLFHGAVTEEAPVPDKPHGSARVRPLRILLDEDLDPDEDVVLATTALMLLRPRRN